VGIGTFIDKQRQPTMDEVFAALGDARPAWEHLVEYVSASYRVQSDFRYYGKSYGWAQRIRKGSKALLSLYPRQGGFAVQIVLVESGVQEALRGNLGPNARRAIAAANPYPEGRWLFVDVESDEDVADVKTLLGLKARPAESQG
jgi:hypothetical protein